MDDENPIFSFDDYKEIGFDLDKEEKSFIKKSVIKNICFMLLFSFGIFITNNILHGHIAIGILAVFFYVSVHFWKVYNNILNYEHSKFQNCKKCGGATTKSLANSNSDIDIYYCTKCKTYFKDYHIWPIS